MPLIKNAMRMAGLLALLAALGPLGALMPGPLAKAQESSTQRVKIPDGTLVPLYLKDDLTSKKNKPNDPVRFQVRADVRVNGVVVIPSRTWVSGHVLEVGGAGFAGHAGKLNFSVDSLKAPDGTTIPLRGSPTIKGGSSAAVAAAATAAYGPAGLFIRGSHADIRKGTMFSAYVDGDHEVVVTLLRLSAAADNPPAAPPLSPATGSEKAQPSSSSPSSSEADAAEEPCTLIVKSDPQGAEILVDGRYLGNTTSTLRLAAGEHTIAVRKAGFVSWQRKMTASAGGNVTIDASLKAAMKALRLDQLTGLLSEGVPEARLVQLVKERGVDFPLNNASEQRLRGAGAGDILIQAIRDANAPP
jgi:hypothetical protein